MVHSGTHSGKTTPLERRRYLIDLAYAAVGAVVLFACNIAVRDDVGSVIAIAALLVSIAVGGSLTVLAVSRLYSWARSPIYARPLDAVLSIWVPYLLIAPKAVVEQNRISGWFLLSAQHPWVVLAVGTATVLIMMATLRPAAEPEVPAKPRKRSTVVGDISSLVFAAVLIRYAGEITVTTVLLAFAMAAVTYTALRLVTTGQFLKASVVWAVVVWNVLLILGAIP